MIVFLAMLLAAQPGAYERRERTALLDFRFGWPAEADGIPGLRTELRRRMNTSRAEALAGARLSRDSAREAHVPFYREQYDTVWSVEAGNTRFLSLTADNRTDQNGAHPNRDFDALIWDRSRGRATSAAALLGRAALGAMNARYCSALNAMIAARGGEPAGRCPPLAERALSFSDRDHDGRFDTLHVLVAPYVAASYADGSFVVDVVFNRGDLSGLAAEDRAAFEEAPGR
jgi:hypothetical protein